jgi:hypothetical protein
MADIDDIHSCSPYCTRPGCVAQRDAVLGEPVAWKEWTGALKSEKTLDSDTPLYSRPSQGEAPAEWLKEAERLLQDCGPIWGTDALLAHLRRRPVAVPEGFALVPLEPTQAMLDAVAQKPHPTRPDGWRAHYSGLYRAMIAAHAGPGGEVDPFLQTR